MVNLVDYNNSSLQRILDRISKLYKSEVEFCTIFSDGVSANIYYIDGNFVHSTVELKPGESVNVLKNSLVIIQGIDNDISVSETGATYYGHINYHENGVLEKPIWAEFSQVYKISSNITLSGQ